MAETKSTQVTKLDARPKQQLTVQEAGGRVRAIPFDWEVPVGNAAIADTAQLCKVPAGARILGGRAVWSAMSTAGGAATGELGDGTTAGKYLEATSMDAAGASAIADDIARNFNEILTEELTLTLTVSVEAFAAGGTLEGYVLVMLGS